MAIKVNCALRILAASAGLAASPVAAQPVTRQCEYKGEGKLGPLEVAFDEAAHWVRVTAPDGQVWHYQDGVTGRISPPTTTDDLGAVEQFVELRADRGEVGFRWPDDRLTGHLAS